jgi:hypothetical protein
MFADGRDRLRQAADDLKTEAGDAQTRFAKRITDAVESRGGAWNSTALADVETFLADARHSLNISSVPNLFHLEDSDVAAAMGSSMNGTTGIFDALLQRLDSNSTSALDPKQLAGVAMLQAWALRRLAKLHPSSRPTATSLASGTAKLQQFGRPIPDHVPGAIIPQLCVRLQNFGNAVGYRSVYMGTPPCAAPDNAALDEMEWGTKGAFTVACRRPEEPESLLRKGLHCELAVSSDSGRVGGGSGSLLEFDHPAAWHAPRLNAISLKVCNKPAITAQQYMKLGTAAAAAANSTIVVRHLAVNGRPVTDDTVSSSHASLGPDGCVTLRYGVPSRSMSSGFVLTGWLELGSDGNRPFGLGPLASVEVDVGEYSLLSGGMGDG